jgi:hypothetical protein
VIETAFGRAALPTQNMMLGRWRSFCNPAIAVMLVYADPDKGNGAPVTADSRFDGTDRKFAALSAAVQRPLVTNDNDLLAARNVTGIDALTPRAFLAREGKKISREGKKI